VKNIRLLPVVVMAIAALLVLKTFGLVTNGGYVLNTRVQAADEVETLALPGEPTIADTSPTLTDLAPTVGAPEVPALGAPAQPGSSPLAQALLGGTHCTPSDAAIAEDGTIGAALADPLTLGCLPSGDAIPLQLDGRGGMDQMLGAAGVTQTEQLVLERLTDRRTALEQYEQELAMRAALVDAAEKRIDERTTTLAALEAQISALVDQRQELETGQFAGIVAMYDAMKPKDAAKIFNNLEMNVLLRVAKTMSPRKMAPILAEMDAARAQELTVQMANLADRPPTEMTPDDFAALPQIVGR
jgi:flagellar motility protein MotE (MotC chaperone)